MSAALLFLDSMAGYSTEAQAAKKYAGLESGGATWTREATGGPTNGPHLLAVATGAGASYHITPRMSRRQSGAWTPTVAGLIGFSLKVDELTRIAAGGGVLARFLDSSTTMLTVTIGQNGSVTITRVSLFGDTAIASGGAGAILSDTWQQIQIRWDLRNASGRVAVRVGSTTVADSGLMDTLGDGTVVTAVRLLALGSEAAPTAQVRMASLFLFGMDAYTDTDWLDGRSVGRRAVIAAGTTNDWTANTGTNAAAVDDTAPDDDTTYVAATADGTLELYTLEDVPAGVIPDAQQMDAWVRREADGAAAVAPTVRHSGANTAEAAQGIADEAYSYLLHPMDVNPGTAAAWTEADANAAEYGLAKTG